MRPLVHALQSLPQPTQARSPRRPPTLLMHDGLVQRYGGDTALTYAYLASKAYSLATHGRRGSEIITSWDELRTVLPTLLRRPSTTPPQPWSTIRLATVRTHLQTSGLITWERKGTGDKRLRLTVHPERLEAALQGLTVPPPAPIAAAADTPEQLTLPIMSELPPANPLFPRAKLAFSQETHAGQAFPPANAAKANLAFSGFPHNSKSLNDNSAAPVLPQDPLSVVGLLPRANEADLLSVGTLQQSGTMSSAPPPLPQDPTAPTPWALSTPVNRGLPTRPEGKPLLESAHEPTNEPEPLSRQGRDGLQPRKTPAGQVWRGIVEPMAPRTEDGMHAIERPAHGRQVIYQAILSGGWRVFLPWASQRELEALIASGPQDPNDPLYIPMQLARWIDSNRAKGADFHLGPLWREHFTTRWMAGARSRFLPSLPPPDPAAAAQVVAQRTRGAEARASNPALREAVKAAKHEGAMLMARGRVTSEAWRAFRRALDQAEDLATVDALIATLP